MPKFQFKQIIKGPTRVTKNSRTLIDMVFTNIIDQITKTYNLLTGLSDHNMISTVRKLTKKRLQSYSTNNPDHVKTFIP